MRKETSFLPRPSWCWRVDTLCNPMLIETGTQLPERRVSQWGSRMRACRVVMGFWEITWAHCTSPLPHRATATRVFLTEISRRFYPSCLCPFPKFLGKTWGFLRSFQCWLCRVSLRQLLFLCFVFPTNLPQGRCQFMSEWNLESLRDRRLDYDQEGEGIPADLRSLTQRQRASVGQQAAPSALSPSA